MKILQSLLLLFILSFSITSCKKDDDDKKQETCRLIKTDYYNNGTVASSANYKYENGRVVRVEVPGQSNFNLEYTGERITRRRYFPTGSTTANGLDQISYNADGTISRIEMFNLNGSSQSKYYQIDFAYTGGKLNKATYSEVNSSGTLVVDEEHTFTYTGNNITSQVFKIFNGSQSQSIPLTITHDTNANAFKKINQQVFLIEPFFDDIEGGIFLSLLFSENNVKEIKAATGSIPFEYTNDAKGYLSSFLLGGQKVAGFNYECQ
jgi:hypothetical protein